LAVAILVVLMVVTLIWALVANSIPLIYLSIACSVAAAAILITDTARKIKAYRQR
jgi:hypothetical protein